MTAVKLGHMHGGVAAHRAWRWCRRFGELVMGDESRSLVMVLGLVEVWKHVLEGNDRV